MTDNLKKDKNDDAGSLTLEFESSGFDLDVESSGSLALSEDSPASSTNASSENSGNGDLDLSFDADDSELSFGTDVSEAVEETVGADLDFGSDVSVPQELQEDIESFNQTRADFKMPDLKDGTVDSIEFDVSDGDEIEFNGSDKAAAPSAINLATTNLTEVVKELKSSSNYATAVHDVETLQESEFAASDEETEFSFDTEVTPPAVKIEPAKKVVQEIQRHSPMPVTDVKDDVELHATLRQMREEREDLLKQIKDSKNIVRELEQDNLTFKSALEESKIEVSILRKRHSSELEDLKYRLSFSEDKKILAEERAKVLLGQKEKLEQKVRIDINQVKQREKELETKLEMLSIDVDSQVQSRDQKILELRRKIDSLEFNMENVSNREQKSSDDKRKIEDKLNKIMKTLRNSIKNLEDDVDIDSLSGITRESPAGKNK
jgi:hypothetical protein